MSLYHSDRGLYEFQAEGVARAYLRRDNLAVWDTGIGKSHLAMATAALLFEDDEIDHCLVICEKNKIDEWLDDFKKFTKLEGTLYYGTVAKRKKLRDSLPQVVISTYETSRNDAVSLVQVEGRRSKKMEPGPLLEALAGSRVLVVYDEMTKLGNRGSQNHKAHDFMVQHLRGNGACRVMGLTATPIERSPENLYNLGRILMPNYLTVAQFERDYIRSKDIFGNAVKFKNLDADEAEPGTTPFKDFFRPVILRKRKTDPDVVDEFPKTSEEITYVDLSKRHMDFYHTVLDTFDDGSEQTDRLLFGLMRQIAGHPAALIQSEGQMARQIVETVGEEGLRSLGSEKLSRLVEYLIPIVHGQGAQVVVFTFFGPSIIPLMKEALEAVDIRCALNHGKLSDRDRAEDMAAFKAGEKDVFLTSDAGARGINLPQALYVVEYEMSLTHANRTQRVNRIHRIDSEHPSVTFQSFIARDTVEEGIAQLVLKRNKWSDQLLEDDDVGEGFVSAEERRKLLRLAREK